jgi:membrane-associated phospholipid phosphatase
VWVLFICCISITAFAEDGNFFTRLDQDIFDAIYDAPPQREPLGTIMEWGTEFGDPKAIMGLSILLMAYGDDAHRETGRLMSSAFIGTGMVVLGMKEIIRRKRPLDDQVGDPAFPSGHTAFAFAGATILADRYPKLRIPLYIGAGLVGVSRIYLGRHYVSDVVGGAAVGTITGMLVLHHRVTLLRWEF